MKVASLEAIFDALETAGVRYLVVGGIAVTVHGHIRATMDLDLVVELAPENAQRAVRALAGLGYRPQVPVRIEDFADPLRRREWSEQRNMQVFSLVSDLHAQTTVDLFVTEPFDFEREYRRAERAKIAPNIHARVLSLPALIAMKRAAGRALDLEDARQLELILEARGGAPS